MSDTASSSEITVQVPLCEWTALGSLAMEAARTAPWREGDWIVAGLAGGKLEGAAREEAMRVTRREAPELTSLVAVCRAFPPERRRSDLSFEHHSVVMRLSTDGERDQVLGRAAANGWTVKQLRREVLKLRIASGDEIQLYEDDPEDREYVRLVRLWNHTGRSAREMFAGSVEDADLADIAL